ncbi:MAG: CDP-alcohol phosphatidyltransferase family protein [Clostridiales bacterium]|nr:CDP-alcohol phosphatidyltransferase family protein [Candidatus Coliplasma equi]
MAANIITASRIICAIILVFCPTFSGWFYAFYVVGGISDALDGIIARRFGKETIFGAKLDTAADFIFTSVVMAKVIPTVSIPAWLTVWIICVAVIKIVSVIGGLIIYKRFAAEHTVPNKICGAFLFLIPLFIGCFSKERIALITALACTVATFAAIHEWHCIRAGKEIN